MNILFYQTSLSYEYLDGCCEIIKKRKKNYRFGFLIRRRKDNTIREQKSIQDLKQKYKNNLFILSENNSNRYNLNDLKNFENKISKFNIWKVISSDRDYGSGYINDITGYENTFKNNSKKILSDFSKTKNSLIKIIKKFKPHVIFIPNGLSNLDVTILDILAKYYRIKILTPEPYRIKNYFFFSENLISKNLNIKKNYFNTKKKYYDTPLVNNIYNNIIGKNKNISVDADEVKNIIKALNKKNFFQKLLGSYIYIFLKHFYFFIQFKLGYKKNHLMFLKKYNLIKNIYYEICNKRNYDYLKENKKINLKKKYIYYPLHLNPETSTLLKGNDYENQEYLVETISKNIPSDCLLYVKEHPATFKSQPRKFSFYKYLEGIPNVKIINPDADSRNIINNAVAVIVVDGSSGFESMVSGIPLITLKQYNYDFLNLSVTNTNLDELFFDIQKAIQIIKSTSRKNIQKKIKVLIKSIIDNSYSLRDPDTFYFFKKTSNKIDIKINSEDLAYSMIKELRI
jgi:hypothetical protein